MLNLIIHQQTNCFFVFVFKQNGIPVQDNKRVTQYSTVGNPEQRCSILQQLGTDYGIQRELVKL